MKLLTAEGQFTLIGAMWYLHLDYARQVRVRAVVQGRFPARSLRHYGRDLAGTARDFWRSWA